MSEKLVLIDGHSILFRAFYGMPLTMTAPGGTHTNAVYGFLTILNKVLEEEKPDYLAVAFDMAAPTFRHKMYAAYKGNRAPAPAEFHEQEPVMRKILTDMNIPVMTAEGWEADDILGTLAAKANAENVRVSLISGDRDLLQIASEGTTIVIPKTHGGQTTYTRYTPEDVKKEWGVDPDGFIELKALMGDSSDNVPGLPGVGPKTAQKILAQFGTIENAHNHVDEIKPKKAMEAMRDHYDDLKLSLQLVTIRKDAPVDFDRASMKLGSLYNQKVYDDFKELGFKSLLGKFDEKEQDTGTIGTYTEIKELSDAETVFSEAEKCASEADGIVGISLPEEDGTIYAAGISYGTKTYVIIPQGMITEGYVVSRIAKLLTDPGEIPADHEEVSADHEEVSADHEEIPSDYGKTSGNRARIGGTIAAMNIKKLLKTAMKYTGRKAVPDRTDAPDDPYSPEIREKHLFDSVIAAYLLDPLKSDWTYDAIASAYLGANVPSETELIGKKGLAAAALGGKTPIEALMAGGYDPAFVKNLSTLAAAEAETARDSVTPLKRKLDEEKMRELFETVEMPLTYALASMELEGIRASREELKKYSDSLTDRIEELKNSIYEKAGEEFNINSPKQLGHILFEKMKLPGGKKTKTGYSTSADVLEKLAPDAPIVSDILEYRKLTKLKSTYADGLPGCIREDGKIHTTFHQTITATGRLSSTDPNLQNIPMREELGRMIRKCFYPADGCVFVDADYSQIELRILAHMSGDEKLIEAYKEAKDIHRITASQVFHVPFDEVTDLMRRNAKAVNFGIVYGISSFGLSQGLSISRREAQDYIEKYFATYPKIKTFLDGLVASAKENGYAISLYGRRRPVPELRSSNFAQRSFGERVAMNSPIQGSAADIMKIAMNRVYTRLAKELPEAKLILQIHDEVLVEVSEAQSETARKIVDEEMTHAAHLKVALVTSSSVGSDWYEAK